MKCRLYSIVYKTVLFVYLAAVAYLCFADFDSLPDVQKTILGIPTDKIVHFAMFFPFPWIAYGSMDRTPDKASSVVAGVINVCALGCILAGITEIVQGALPYRSQDLHDYAADCLAICLCGVLLLAFHLVGFYRRKKR